MGDAEAPARRVTGRILSLGFPLPGIRVDNYNFLTAPSFFDYDALVVDPSRLSRLIEDVIDGTVEARSFGDRRIRNQPEHAGDVALGELLLRRRDETRVLLARGGVAVCFAHPAATHARLVGAADLDDYYWLGATAPDLVAGEGTQAEVCDYEHPLAPFVLGQLANLSYRAHLRDAKDPFVRSYGGAAIGGELPGGGGRIVMLPALKSLPGGDGRYVLSEALQSGIRRMLGVAAEGHAPPWVRGHALPALEDRATEVADARKTLQSAQAALESAERGHDEVGRYQRLLWQQGQVGFEDTVIDALRLLGCDVYAHDANALELREGRTRVLVEIEAGGGAIGLAPHYRLRQRIERVIERTGEAPRGLIIVNGHRLMPPAERPDQASEALRTAAETMHYPIMTTIALHEAVAARLRGDDDAVAAFRRSISESGEPRPESSSP